MKVQLLTFPDCPNAAAAREVLQRVLEASGIRAPIEEVDTVAAETPEHLRGWGSPTVLIDDVDLEGQQTPDGAGCRLYRDDTGRMRGVPSEAIIVGAVTRHGTR